MKKAHVNLKVVKCTLSINQEHPWMHATLQSWTKVFGQMCTCGSLQTQKESRDIQPTRPQPLYNVENMYPQLFPTFNIVLGGGGGNCNVVLKYSNAFRGSAQIFDNYEFCIAVPRYFVQDCRFFMFMRLLW